MERQAVHKTIKTTKHFFSITNSDSNDFDTDTHNPAQMQISFGNSGITNVQSYNDETKTKFHIMSLSADLFYNNVSQSFRNNKINISTITTNNSAAIRVGGTPESGANSAPIVVEFPTKIYQTGTEIAAAITAALNAKLIAWIGGNVINNFLVAFSQATNNLTISYNVDAPAGISALLPIIVVKTVFVAPDTISYDSSRILGTTTSKIGGVDVLGSFQLPFANRVAGATFPNFVDIQTLQTIRIHSNIAKRFFVKVGPKTTPASQRILALTDILFEIPLDAQLGQTINYVPHDDRYSQEIHSNFDELRITITDNNNNPVQFLKSAEINITFAIEREIIIPDNDERIKALSEYNRFKSY